LSCQTVTLQSKENLSFHILRFEFTHIHTHTRLLAMCGITIWYAEPPVGNKRFNGVWCESAP